MATGAQADVPRENDQGAVDTEEAVRRRHEAGPLVILKMPDDDNPGLPPEVWPHPPAGYKLPE